MITKAIDLCVKDIDLAKREAVIAHATYKSLDGDGDRSNKGMFLKSWNEQFGILRFFLNHKKDQAPGRPLRAWDDDDHAYTQVKLGTHTLGEDVLKMLDEKVIVAASFGFEPTKSKEIKGKGLDFLEVKHYETSVLTHWGAHPESGPKAVTKSFNTGMMPKFRVKSLSEPEQLLLGKLIANGMDSIQACIEIAMQLDVDSDLYSYIMYIISRQADQVGSFRSELRYGMKEKVANQIEKMQKFIRNSTASDESILLIQKSLNQLLIQHSDTAITTHGGLVKCSKCDTYTATQVDEHGTVKCADCDHVITKGNEQEASRSKDVLRKATALRIKMMLEAD